LLRADAPRRVGLGHVPPDALCHRRARRHLQGREHRGASRQGSLTSARREVGAAGEDAVARWYADAGFTVLARNWRVREGELDLAAGPGEAMVCGEVKPRRSDAFGLPAEAVTPTKQARIRRLAVQWLAASGERSAGLRFDVAAVKPDGRGHWIVDVLEGA